MRADDERTDDILRHGAYLCWSVPPAARAATAAAAVPALAERLGLCNEFAPGGDHPADAVAFLRRVDAAPGGLADEGLSSADLVVHVASARGDLVTELCTEAARLLGGLGPPRLLRGVVRPMVYTGNAMHNFAYAHRVLQSPGTEAPHAFLAPMSKTADWWAKDWMERHTYFLPRYDGAGRMVGEGHALAAAAGISCLMRRTYKNAVVPTTAGASVPLHATAAGEYDFINYFECAEADVPTFHAVCAALRDVERNPEWRFVREGPIWHGRRVARWAELFD